MEPEPFQLSESDIGSLSGSLVLLTGSGPEHRYVTARLARAFSAQLRAVILAETPPAAPTVRLRRYLRRYSIPQFVSRMTARLYRKALGLDASKHIAVERVLDPPPTTAEALGPGVLRIVPGHNSKACKEILDRIGPDILVVFGTDIIRDSVLEKARVAAINLHTGISPRYRGADSVFWTLHNEEPEWVGATVHIASSGLDAGPILDTVRTGFEPDDDENTLFAKAVREGAERLVAAVPEVLAGRTRPVPQDTSKGNEYRFVHRTVGAERRVRRLLKTGLLSRREGAVVASTSGKGHP